MSPIATLMYGLKVEEKDLPIRMTEILGTYGKYDRYTLAWSLLELYGFEVEAGEDGDGDYVTELEQKTGLTVHEFGVEDFYIGSKHLSRSVYGHKTEKIGVHSPDFHSISRLSEVATKLGIEFEPAWYLNSDSD
jgi:hypothetical protein